MTNPYEIVEIPEGILVTFSVVVDPLSSNFGYRISSATLNGIALNHNGTTCSFNMPGYNSRLVFVLTATSGDDFSYTYTGTSSASTITSGDRSWKLIKFSTSGVLTIDSDQIDAGIVADIWARGAGGGASSSAAGTNGYDVSETAVQLNASSVTITIGEGGTYGATRGRAGGTTSWGTFVQAPGGSGGSSAVSNLGGDLDDIFGLVENSTDGAGGTIGNAGSNGAVWLRIAI
jgi:hypothetical protein